MPATQIPTHRNLIALLALFCTLSLITTPANASGGVFCASKDGIAEISINMGRVPIYAPTFAAARLGKKQWSSMPQPGDIELGSSQGLIRKDTLSVDFADANIEKIIITLEVNYSGEEFENGYPGTLIFEDGIKHNVFCEFE